MQPFGEFLMRSRKNAGLIAFLFALVPFLNWLAVIIMALVTLRRGAKEGILILGFILVPMIVWTYLTPNHAIAATNIGGAIVVFMLAVVLHNTHNWSNALLLGAGLAIIAIISLHAYIGDINAWWQQKMLATMQTVSAEAQINTSEQQAQILYLAKIATGLQAAVLLLISFCWLVLARLWQAILYNPGALRQELHNIRMPRWASIVFVLFIIAAFITKNAVIIDLLPVVFLVYALAGLSLVHFILKARQLHWGWYVLLYAAMVIFLQVMLLALVFMALSDSVLNLRSRFKAQTKT